MDVGSSCAVLFNLHFSRTSCWSAWKRRSCRSRAGLRSSSGSFENVQLDANTRKLDAQMTRLNPISNLRLGELCLGLDPPEVGWPRRKAAALSYLALDGRLDSAEDRLEPDVSRRDMPLALASCQRYSDAKLRQGLLE